MEQVPPWKGEEILVLKVGSRYCCFAVTSKEGSQLYELAYYEAVEISDTILNQLLILHPELNQPFLKVIIGYDFSPAVILPGSYLNPEKTFTLLNSMYGTDKKSVAVTDPVLPGSEFSVYAVPYEVQGWFKSEYPDAKYFHISLPGILSIPNDNINGTIRVDFSTGHFILTVSNEGRLLLAHTVSYSTPDDVIYYLLKACRQFSISVLDVQLVISGLIEKQSALFHELYQYFINIDFKNAGWSFPGENPYPLHFFTVLNEMQQCES